MVFSSLPFLFYYLPVTLAIYFAAPLKWRNALLLAANLFFYAWGEPVYIVIMLLSILIDYAHGYLVQKHRENDRKARRIVCQSVVFNLALLLFFKYYDFFVSIAVGIVPPLAGVLQPLGLPLPLGISFYTFQTMSYTIDVYRKDAPVQKNIVDFGVFVTLFPQLIAGPIVKYKTIAAALDNRTVGAVDFSVGVRLFTVGLCKKVLLANNIGALWQVYQTPQGWGAAESWLGITAFAFQLYFDFSGYSDMACGLGRMLGFRFGRNFRYPYAALSLSELWRRWHISLTSWFREYVYIPLGGNRYGRARTIRNICLVWLLTGFWHGAAWNFILWGAYFAVLLTGERFIWGKWLARAPRIFRRGYTLGLYWISLAVFAVEGGLQDIAAYLAGMLGGNGWIATASVGYYFRSYTVLICICAVGATPLPKLLYARLPLQTRRWVSLALIPAGMLASTAFLAAGSFNPFLYFRF